MEKEVSRSLSKEEPTSLFFIKGWGDISSSFILFNCTESAIVDCGSSRMARKIIQEMEKSELKKHDVKWIVLTHTHYDHSQGVKFLLEKLPSAKVVVHDKEYDNLLNGELQFPKPTKTFRGNLNFLKTNPDQYFKIDKFKKKEITKMEGKELSLCKEIKLLWTPGHSKGSISIEFCGSFIVGDSIECYDGVHCFPTFCDDLADMFKSWQLLIERAGENEVTVYPSHGIETNVECLKKELERYGFK